MEILYEKSFSKDLNRIQHKKTLKKRLLEVIENIKNADTLKDVKNVRKIGGYRNYYRIRIGDYRVGLKVTEKRAILIRLLHRKEIYRKFP